MLDFIRNSETILISSFNSLISLFNRKWANTNKSTQWFIRNSIVLLSNRWKKLKLRGKKWPKSKIYLTELENNIIEVVSIAKNRKLTKFYLNKKINEFQILLKIYKILVKMSMNRYSSINSLKCNILFNKINSKDHKVIINSNFNKNLKETPGD